MNFKIASGILFSALLVPGLSAAADAMKQEPKKAEATTKTEVKTQTKADVKSSDAKSTVKNAASEVKETVGDTIITTKIKAEYAKDKDVSALNIKVDTDQKGVVVLSGMAKTKAEADKAVAIAKKTKGVTSVTNDIKVEGMASASAPMKSEPMKADTKKADSKKY